MRCWPARLPHSVGTLVPVTPPVTCVPQLETIFYQVFTITEKAPTRPFSRLKALTSAFTFRTLLRHYTKLALNRKYRVSQNIVVQS